MKFGKESRLFRRVLKYDSIVGSTIKSYDDWIDNIGKRQLYHLKFPVSGGGYIKIEDVTAKGPTSTSGDDTVPFLPAAARDTKSNYYVSLSGRLVEYDARGVATGKSDTYNPLFSVPLMVRSKYCATSKMNEEELLRAGESPEDPGCSFITGRPPVAIIHQENLRLWKFMIYKPKSSSVDPICNIKFSHNGSFAMVKLVRDPNYMTINLRLGFMGGKEKNFGEGSNVTKKYEEDVIPVVSAIAILLYDKKPKRINYEEILDRIVEYTVHKDRVKTQLYATIAYALQKNVFGALHKKLKKPKKGETPNVWKEMREEMIKNLFSNYESDQITSKLNMLYFMTARYCEYFIGERKLDDRDNWENKKVETPAVSMQALFSEILKVKINVKTKVTAKVKGKVKTEKLKSYTQTRNRIKSEFSRVLPQMMSSFNPGKWGDKVVRRNKNGKNENRTEYLINAYNVLGLINIILKINKPTSRKSKIGKVRAVNGSQFGNVCPVETPEDSQCGLVQMLASLAYVSLEDGAADIIEPLISHMTSSTKTEKHKNIVMLNGFLMGWCDLNELKPLARKIKRVHRTTCVVVDSDNILQIYTDSSRLTRPVLVADNGTLLISENNAWNKPIDYLVRMGYIEYLDTFEQGYSFIATSEKELQEWHTHCEVHKAAFLGPSASNIPFSNSNQGPRNTYQAAMSRQAIGIKSNPSFNMDATEKSLLEPTESPVLTHSSDLYGLEHSPITQTVICAFSTYGGWNEEDAIVFNKDSVDRGMFRMQTWKVYSATSGKNKEDDAFAKNVKESNDKKMKQISALGDSGIAIVGKAVKENYVVIQKKRKIKGDDSTCKEVFDSSTKIGMGQEGIVERVTQYGNGEQTKATGVVKVKVRQVRSPMPGDKYASGHAQKGTLSKLVPSSELPFIIGGRNAGLVPDIMVNPHAMPSRMTIGNLKEALWSKAVAIECIQMDGTPFGNSDHDTIGKILEEAGMERYGGEVMRSGITGRLLQDPTGLKPGELKGMIDIFPIRYQALKHQTGDKAQSRGTGPIHSTTRQPVSGRANHGGQKVGEMERDAILSHGAASFLQERFSDSSDRFTTFFCTKCGTYANNVFSDKVCSHCKGRLVAATITHGFRLMTQLLQAASIKTKMNLKIGSKL